MEIFNYPKMNTDLASFSFFAVDALRFKSFDREKREIHERVNPKGEGILNRRKRIRSQDRFYRRGRRERGGNQRSEPVPHHGRNKKPSLINVYVCHILLAMDIYDFLLKCTGFEWDEHNAGKIWEKHQVTPSECEAVFFNRPLVVADDAKHSEKENRLYALGRTDAGRMLFVVFTLRRDYIRVISARDMNKKERKVYLSHE